MMHLTPHSAADYERALELLLPPGKAWEWPDGSLGHALLFSTAQELTRLEHAIPDVLEVSISRHRPKFSGWQLSEYQRVAEEALRAAGVEETLPRRMCAIGSAIGVRLWSAAVLDAASGADFPVPLVQCLHLFAPMAIGRCVGDGTGRDPAARMWSWSGRTRYILIVRYYRSVTPPNILLAALTEFQQAHVAIWLEDITGVQRTEDR